MRFVVITDYKGKKFLGWRAAEDLARQYSDTERLKNTPPSCRNKGTPINAKFEPLVGKTCYEIGIYEKLVTSIIIHISYNPKHRIFVFLSFEPGTDVQPVI